MKPEPSDLLLGSSTTPVCHPDGWHDSTGPCRMVSSHRAAVAVVVKMMQAVADQVTFTARRQSVLFPFRQGGQPDTLHSWPPAFPLPPTWFSQTDGRLTRSNWPSNTSTPATASWVHWACPSKLGPPRHGLSACMEPRGPAVACSCPVTCVRCLVGAGGESPQGNSIGTPALVHHAHDGYVRTLVSRAGSRCRGQAAEVIG